MAGPLTELKIVTEQPESSLRSSPGPLTPLTPNYDDLQPNGDAIYMRPDVHYEPSHFKDKVVLFFAREMKDVAETVARMSKGKVLLGEISFGHFPDGFPNLRIMNARVLKWCQVAFLASLHTPEVIFEQIALIHAIPRELAKTFTVIIPWFPTGTMERVETRGEVATASSLARLLSVTPHAARGPTQLVIYDIHALQNLFYFTDNVHVQLKGCASLLRSAISALPDKDVVIAFPDDGAHKRFAKSYRNWPQVICHKIREGDKRFVKIKEGEEECKGKHVVIVDDLVQSGGTLIEAAKVLRQAGAKRVSGFVTHAVFPKDAWKRFVRKQDGGSVDGELPLDKFWISNSNPIAKKLANVPPFQVLDIAPIVASSLLETLDS